MGLDSAIYKTKHFYGFGEKLKVSVKGKIDKDFPRKDNVELTNYSEDNLEFLTITTEVAYWRKANQIHKWFVDKLGGGKDECQRIPVRIEDLQELLKICKKIKRTCKLKVVGEVEADVWDMDQNKLVKKKVKQRVIENPEVAKELLPTESGFFFGSTDYGEWYMEDIDNTIKQLEKIIKDSETENMVDYYYQASW